VAESVLLAPATGSVELDIDVAGAEREKTEPQDFVHDEVVAALYHLKVERLVRLHPTGQRRAPADLARIDDTIRQLRMHKRDIEPKREGDDEHHHVERQVHVYFHQGHQVPDESPANEHVYQQADDRDHQQHDDGVDAARPELGEYQDAEHD